jgi:hypothetical protein
LQQLFEESEHLPSSSWFFAFLPLPPFLLDHANFIGDGQTLPRVHDRSNEAGTFPFPLPLSGLLLLSLLFILRSVDRTGFQHSCTAGRLADLKMRSRKNGKYKRTANTNHNKGHTDRTFDNSQNTRNNSEV